MSTEHTPGPWKLIGKQGTAIWAGAEIIAQSSISRAAPRVAHANSLLMAAAPDLLEALELFLRPFEDDHIEVIKSDYGEGTARRVEAGRAAISKAKGQA